MRTVVLAFIGALFVWGALAQDDDLKQKVMESSHHVISRLYSHVTSLDSEACGGWIARDFGIMQKVNQWLDFKRPPKACGDSTCFLIQFTKNCFPEGVNQPVECIVSISSDQSSFRIESCKATDKNPELIGVDFPMDRAGINKRVSEIKEKQISGSQDGGGSPSSAASQPAR